MKHSLFSSIRPVLIALIISLTALGLTACIPQEISFESGTYILRSPGTELIERPFIVFNTDDSTWWSSASMLTDAALSGTFTRNGEDIYAEDSTKQVVIALKIQENSTLKVVKAPWRYNGLTPWIHKHEHYVLEDKLEEVEASLLAEENGESAEDVNAASNGENTEDADNTDDADSNEKADDANDDGNAEDVNDADQTGTSKPDTENDPEAATKAEVNSEKETLSAEETMTTTPEEVKAIGPAVAEGPVKDMIRKGLSYVQAGCGYSLQDRQGINGSFDCSGLVAVLLRDSFGCTNYGWDGNNPWDTAWWRSLGSYLNIGDKVQFGTQTYVVTMKDTEDYQAAWSVPGSIVVQYSPRNHPEKTMGHISVALGVIEYTDVQQVVTYLNEEYGLLLDGMTVTGLPMVYDQYGSSAGHTVFKINANGVANCVIVDNNYASDPEWIEPVSLVFAPVN